MIITRSKTYTVYHIPVIMLYNLEIFEERKLNSEISESFHSENKMLVAQSCLILCDPMDCSPPGSSVHGIFQTGILEWFAISFCRELS